MTKVNEYTILDDPFYETLVSFTEELDRQNINYALVGGAGIQTKIASILSKNGKMSINDAHGLELVVRKTGDLDIALDLADETKLSEFSSIYNSLYQGNKSLQQITNKAYRTRKNININLETCADDFKGLPNSYKDIIETSEAVTLRKGNGEATVYVAKPEYLVASKLTRLEEKDRIDIYNLMNIMHQNKINFSSEEVKNILKANGKENCIDYLKQVHFEIVK